MSIGYIKELLDSSSVEDLRTIIEYSNNLIEKIESRYIQKYYHPIYSDMPVKLRSFINYIYNDCHTFNRYDNVSKFDEIECEYNFSSKIFTVNLIKYRRIFNVVLDEIRQQKKLEKYLELLDNPIVFEIKNDYDRRVLLLCDGLGYNINFKFYAEQNSYIEIKNDYDIKVFITKSDNIEYHHYLSKFRNYRRY